MTRILSSWSCRQGASAIGVTSSTVNAASQFAAWTCKTPLKSVGATARRRAGATARRHHPNPAEADRRWRGERSKPVRLAVRGHHTRSVGEESPAQTAQWCCWFCRRRIIFGSAEIAATRVISARQIDGRKTPINRARAAYLPRRSSNANSLCGRNSAGSPESDLSKGYFATTFLSSNLTCPARQSLAARPFPL
jgi:hypothetical protein